MSRVRSGCDPFHSRRSHHPSPEAAHEQQHHQLRRRHRHDAAGACEAKERRGAPGDSARHEQVPRSRARDGEQPLAHAVRRVHRHHHRHVRPEGDRQDRRAGPDAHGAGRTAARGSLAGASQEEAAVPAQHRDRQPHARLGGVLPDQGRPGRRRARAAQFLRDVDQVGEPVGHARGSVHRARTPSCCRSSGPATDSPASSTR